jgi:hypothetical protein
MKRDWKIVSFFLLLGIGLHHHQIGHESYLPGQQIGNWESYTGSTQIGVPNFVFHGAIEETTYKKEDSFPSSDLSNSQSKKNLTLSIKADLVHSFSRFLDRIILYRQFLC